MDTRSLSVTFIGNSYGDTANLALLYYENPKSNVAALLQRGSTDETQYVDITDQSKEIPDDFRNVPLSASHTLFESNPVGIFSSPFASQGNWHANMGALFISAPNRSAANSGSSVSIEWVGYDIDPSGPGDYSTCMHCANWCPERSFAS